MIRPGAAESFQAAVRGGPGGKVKAYDGSGNEEIFTGADVHAAALAAKKAGYRYYQIYEMNMTRYKPPEAAAPATPSVPTPKAPTTTTATAPLGIKVEMFNVGGDFVSASYVARKLHHIWVEQEDFRASAWEIEAGKRELFAQKVRLYCEAAALRVILTERETNESYEGLLREFEKLIFPTRPDMTKLEAVKSAMQNLDQLFTEKKELSWCRSWFAGIGHNETNPYGLALLARLLGLHTTSLRKFIHEIGPPHFVPTEQVTPSGHSFIRRLFG